MISAVSQQLKDELAPIIGDVKIKNLFAGYGIFYSEMMFAIYQNGSLYLRAEDELAQYLESLGAAAYSRNPDCSDVLVLYHYYQLPLAVQKDKARLGHLISLSLKQIQTKKLTEALAKKSRIKELANLSIKHERLLAKINIYTVDEFRSLGATNSYVRLKKLGIPINIDMLWRFAAALKNKHVHLLTEKEKHTLFIRVNELLEANGLRKIKR